MEFRVSNLLQSPRRTPYESYDIGLVDRPRGFNQEDVEDGFEE